MVCRACGRTIANENANFCEYCGTATDAGREGGMDYGGSAAEAAGNAAYRRPFGQAGDSYGAGSAGGAAYGNRTAGDPGLAGILNGTAGLAEAENSIGFLHWIVVMLLPMVPMIGMFAYLALLLIWAFGHTASKTRKNWARATLIVTVLSFFMAAYMLEAMLGSEGMAELMNSVLGAGGGA